MLVIDVFSNVEKYVSIIFLDLLFKNLISVLIIITVPLIVKRVFYHTCIVTIGQGAVVIYYAAKIVLARNILAG